MFDTFFFDIVFIQTTFVFALLVFIALWQKLKPFAGIMCGMYIIFIVFSIFDSNNNSPQIINSINEKADTSISKILTKIPLVNEEDIVSDTFLETANQTSIKARKVKLKVSDKKSNNLANISTLTSNDIKKDVLIIPNKVIKSKIAKNNPLRIKFFKLGRGLKNRELIDIDSTFYTHDRRIYCMTTIQNQNNGKVIFHNWYRDNKLMSKIRMEIGWSYNWRTWSYINVNNDRTGNWKIVVTDSLNVRYDSLFFNIENTLP